MSDRICSVASCDRPERSRGYCASHYMRAKRHGDPEAGIRPHGMSLAQLIEYFSAPEGDCLVWTASLASGGYGGLDFEGKRLPAHRVAWELANGPVPGGMVVDHKCHNRRCVKVEHLRLATFPQNSANRRGPMPNSSTGIRNVRKVRSGAYEVHVKARGERHYYGTFYDLEEATKVAEQARRDLFGEFAGRGKAA